VVYFGSLHIGHIRGEEKGTVKTAKDFREKKRVLLSSEQKKERGF